MFSNEDGFTMAELMVAVMILTIGLLGLFQAVYATINYSMRNDLRRDGISYGDELMAHELNQPFANLSVSQASSWTRSGTMRRPLNGGFAYASYSSVRTHVYASDNSTNVQITVSWKYKGTKYSHNLATVVSK